MNQEAKEQYMSTLRERYLRASKKGKGEILDEYCRNTGQERKYVIKKFRYTVKTKAKQERKNRTKHYDGPVRTALITCWTIFDRPCGQRLAPLLKTEVDRLRRFKELTCTNETEPGRTQARH